MELKAFFQRHPKVALGFSGGVDSAYLLYAAKQYGADVSAYFIESQFQPEFEKEDAERLAEDDHGDEQAGGELRGGHDGGEARGQVRRAHAEEQDRAEQAKEAGDDGKEEDALGEDARDDVVWAHRERHDHGARAHDDAALPGRAGGLDLAGEGDEEGAGHGRPQ